MAYGQNNDHIPEDDILGDFQQDQMQQSMQDPMRDALKATPQVDKVNASYTNQIKNTHPDDEVGLALQAGANATDAQQQAVHVERASSTADGGTNWGMALGQILAAGLMGGLDAKLGTNKLDGFLTDMNKARAEYDAKLSRAKKYQLFLEQNPESAETLAKLGGVDALASMSEKDAAEAFARIEGEVDVAGQLKWMEESGMWTGQELGAFSTAKDTQDLGWMVAMTQQQKQQKREQTSADLKEYEVMFASTQKTLTNLVANPPTNLGPASLKTWYSDRYAEAMQVTASQFRGANPDNPYLNSLGPENSLVQGMMGNFKTFADNHMNGQALAAKQSASQAVSGYGQDQLYTAWHAGEKDSTDRDAAEEALMGNEAHLNSQNVIRRAQAALVAQKSAEGVDTKLLEDYNDKHGLTALMANAGDLALVEGPGALMYQSVNGSKRMKAIADGLGSFGTGDATNFGTAMDGLVKQRNAKTDLKRKLDIVDGGLGGANWPATTTYLTENDIPLDANNEILDLPDGLEEAMLTDLKAISQDQKIALLSSDTLSGTLLDDVRAGLRGSLNKDVREDIASTSIIRGNLAKSATVFRENKALEIAKKVSSVEEAEGLNIEEDTINATELLSYEDNLLSWNPKGALVDTTKSLDSAIARVQDVHSRESLENLGYSDELIEQLLNPRTALRSLLSVYGRLGERLQGKISREQALGQSMTPRSRAVAGLEAVRSGITPDLIEVLSDPNFIATLDPNSSRGRELEYEERVYAGVEAQMHYKHKVREQWSRIKELDSTHTNTLSLLTNIDALKEENYDTAGDRFTVVRNKDKSKEFAGTLTSASRSLRDLGDEYDPEYLSLLNSEIKELGYLETQGEITQTEATQLQQLRADKAAIDSQEEMVTAQAELITHPALLGITGQTSIGGVVTAIDFVGGGIYRGLEFGRKRAELIAQGQSADVLYEAGEPGTASLGEPLQILSGDFAAAVGSNSLDVISNLTQYRKMPGNRGPALYVDEVLTRVIRPTMEEGHRDLHTRHISNTAEARSKLTTSTYDKMSNLEVADALRVWAKVKGLTLSEATIEEILGGEDVDRTAIHNQVAFDTAVTIGLGMGQPPTYEEYMDERDSGMEEPVMELIPSGPAPQVDPREYADARAAEMGNPDQDGYNVGPIGDLGRPPQPNAEEQMNLEGATDTTLPRPGPEQKAILSAIQSKFDAFVKDNKGRKSLSTDEEILAFEMEQSQLDSWKQHAEMFDMWKKGMLKETGAKTKKR